MGTLQFHLLEKADQQENGITRRPLRFSFQEPMTRRKNIAAWKGEGAKSGDCLACLESNRLEWGSRDGDP